MKYHIVAIAICVLALDVENSPGVFADPTPTGTNPIKLSAGMEAEIVAIGRSQQREVTISIRLANKSANAVDVLLVGPPSVTDNTGARFRWFHSVGGIASCQDSRAICLGTPEVIKGRTPALQEYTEIAPGTEATINFAVGSDGSKGPLISLAATLAFRTVTDPGREDTLNDAQKRQQLKMMPLTFPPSPVVDAQ